MKFDRYRFSWGTEGEITIQIFAGKTLLSSFTIDDTDSDKFIKDLAKARQEAKRAKRKR
ncbi:hypothetical protein HWB80_gp077 [Streptomyces phage Karimac]|uniref:Uncharacterized protein n=1 Tax=Streptomyces phage Karimac TaxID=2283303 RepID=A0A345MHM9_9CAUD|nr:hypothetical protein HWB80_gp077 [Streptomyces phage Karimac]AXH70060.1 hypothetical protein SEA_KARIMAC_246 [Streptomyces phage Karimac]